MTVRRVPQLAAAASFPLAGCANEAVDAFAAGMISFTGLFVLSLFIYPRVQEYLSRREHHDRMQNRTPFAPEDPTRPRRRRRRRSKDA